MKINLNGNDRSADWSLLIRNPSAGWSLLIRNPFLYSRKYFQWNMFCFIKMHSFVALTWRTVKEIIFNKSPMKKMNTKKLFRPFFQFYQMENTHKIIKSVEKNNSFSHSLKLTNEWFKSEKIDVLAWPVVALT